MFHRIVTSWLAATAPHFTVDETLAPHVYVFYAAFIIAFVFTPVMRVVATYYQIVDRPDQTRKVHRVEVAYLGGVAMFLGWIAGLALSQLTSGYYDPAASAWRYVRISPAIMLGAMVIVGLGLWDDIKRVHPNIKIAGQVLAAAALLAAGIGRNSTRPLLGPIDHRMTDWFHAPLPEWLYFFTGACLTIALVVFCCNAVNLMDGLDGLAGGVTGVIAMGFLFLVTYMAMISGPENAAGTVLRLVLVMALLGAVLGFVPYNFNPASIFMGDTGSLFLGFNCATLILLMAEVDARWLLAALVMFALPVLDTSLAFARRWVNRRPVFSADRMHFHHQLVMRGLTVRKTVIVSYFLSIGFVLLGASVVFMRTRFAFAIYLVVFGSIIVAAFKMGMVHEKSVVTARRQIGAPGTMTAPMLEPGSVLEVREDEKRQQNGDEPSPQI
jgi:UDP-GlcNAc:undecaprenyl-phosphate GlcNAc-1-phosphate transferase